MTRSDPGVVTVRPFTLDDLERAADFCDRARAVDPSIEPFSQRLALIATGSRAMLPLWQVAEGEDGLIYGLVFAAVREQRDAPGAALSKASPTGASEVAKSAAKNSTARDPAAENPAAEKDPAQENAASDRDASPAPAPAKSAPVLSRPPRQPYAGAPDLGSFAGKKIARPPPVLPLAPPLPERPPPRPMTLQPARPLTLQPARPLTLQPARRPPSRLTPTSPQHDAAEKLEGPTERAAPTKPEAPETLEAPAKEAAYTSKEAVPTGNQAVYAGNKDVSTVNKDASTGIPATIAKPSRTTLEIYAAVDPMLRRQGLGRALLAPALGWIEGESEPVSLRARVKDSPEAAPGLAFLRSLGFKQSQAQLSLSWNSNSSIEAHELPALSIKQLQPQDSAGLAQLGRLSEAAWIGAPDSFQTRADELAQLMSELGRVVLLASAEGKGIGYLSGVWLGKTLGIEEVAVLPELRRAGIGRALVTHALKLGARSALLSVSEENTAARALYRKLGFTQVSRKLILHLDSAGGTADGGGDS